jgi:hypothetical protein
VNEFLGAVIYAALLQFRINVKQNQLNVGRVRFPFVNKYIHSYLIPADVTRKEGVRALFEARLRYLIEDQKEILELLKTDLLRVYVRINIYNYTSYKRGTTLLGIR